MNAKVLLVVAALVAVLVLARALLLAPTDGGGTPIAPAIEMPDLPPSAPPRNASEAMGDTLEILEQLGAAYQLTPEELQEIRRIIENANYAP